MGKSAWAIALEPIAGMKTRGAGAVREAVYETLRSEWGSDLGSLGDLAEQWIDYDEVLSFELDTDRAGGPALLFVTNLGVDWPVDLCEHWIALALTLGRGTFDDALSKLGWRFAQRPTDPPLPTMGSHVHRVGPHAARDVYFEHDGAFTRVADGTVASGAICQCPYCKSARELRIE